MAATWRLTQQRLALTSAYVREHVTWSSGGRPLVPDLRDTPYAVAGTLSRLYGGSSTLDRGEVAYWRIDDRGRALGLELRA